MLEPDPWRRRCTNYGRSQFGRRTRKPDIAQRTCNNMNPQESQTDRAQGRTGNAVRAARRVLVVEDEFFLAVQMEEWLLEDGFDVVDVVHTADEAIAVAEAGRPA